MSRETQTHDGERVARCECFRFYREWYEALKGHSLETLGRAFFIVGTYAFYGTIPTDAKMMKGLGKFKAMLPDIMAQIDKDIASGVYVRDYEQLKNLWRSRGFVV